MNILIAEDEVDVALQYKIVLEERNHHVVITKDGEECLKAYHDALKGKEAKTKKGLPFDVVVLDYRMPKKNGMEVAKEILSVNPQQRIIIASAYVKETIAKSVKDLKQVVELMQKPFELEAIVDTIEDKEVYRELQKLKVKVRQIKDLDPAGKETRDLFESLGKIHKQDVWYAVSDIIYA